MALFSNEDVLGWFCATNPIPEIPENVRHIPDIGQGRAALLGKLKAEAAEAETVKQQRREAVRAQFEQKPKSKPAQEGYYEQMERLRRAAEVFDPSQPGDDDLEFEDVGLGRPSNPSALPGDDDYDPQLLNGGDGTVYMGHDFETNKTPPLPIANHREAIVRTIEENSVTVIQGETGSGKSTQVAQYILDHHVETDRFCNIVCTQPRRIAATSIAKYVSECRGWRVGQMVGYQIGMDKCMSDVTRVTFVTTGVLLQKMVHMRNLSQFTHIILDEVHERDKDTDFCLLLVRKLLRTNSKHVKVILMSATIEAPMFANYFSTRVGGVRHPAPLVAVRGRTHPVLEFYLDDIKHIHRVGTCKPMELDNPRITEDAMKIAYNLILSFDEIESKDPASRRGDFVRGTVLLFLPGMPEIREMESLLTSTQGLPDEYRWTILPLHSTISSERQREVFRKPESGRRKIILATNIAESSITVPDIKYVIDFCLVKQLTCDWQTKYVCLKTVLASQASLTQRKGRAGRVSHGRCYRLITRDFYNRRIPEYSTPEMLRCPLESVILKAKKLDFGEPRSILGSALQPPKLDDIERAILNLKEVGALTVKYKGVIHPYNGELTFVGEILETLPIDVRLGKLVVLGHVFGCLEACIVIAASLSTKPMLVTRYNDHLKAYKSQRAWAESSNSDCIAFLNAFKEWRQRHHLFLRSPGEEEHWCRRNKVSCRALKEVNDVVKELTMRLAAHHIHPPQRGLSRAFNDDPHNLLILKLVMCGAFYPQYFRWAPTDKEACQKTMSGHDPKTTVVLSALPRDAAKYSDQICQLFKHCGRGKRLYFEPFKVFVEFEKPHPSHAYPAQATDPVLDAVYVALKRRHERSKLSIYVDDNPDTRVVGGASWKFPAPPSKLDEECASNGAERIGLKEKTLPETGVYHQIVVTEFIDAGHFWAQQANGSTTEKLRKLHRSINEQEQRPLTIVPAKMEGVCCLAPFSEDGLYYRAKIVGILVNEGRKETYAKVVFVDYGNVEEVNTDQLCVLSPRDMALEMQAFECFLTSVKPSIQLSSDGKWSYRANMRFRQLTLDKYLVINVYSVVERKLRVELYDTNDTNDIFINEVLVMENYAQHCEEPYESRIAHIQAQEAQTSEATTTAAGSKVKSYQSTVKVVDWVQDHEGSSHARGKRVEIRGPDSVYEVTFHPMTIVGGYRRARIERDSVNCIVVNEESDDPHERLMVAGHVALSQAGNTCLARHTTLLPNIHGLIHLVTLLFAPCVEMRTDELKEHYTGALCGLGFDPDTEDSIYSEHDIELTFDTIVSQSDLEMINNLRLAINLAVGSDDTIGELNDSMLRKIQSKSRELIKDLILKPRESIPPCQAVRQGWNQVAPGDVLKAETADFEDSSPPLYPLHYGIELVTAKTEKLSIS